MASLPRMNVPPPMSTTASGSNNAVMPATSPAFSLATNSRSKSWGSLAGSLVVKSLIVDSSNGVGCSTFTQPYRRHVPGVNSAQLRPGRAQPTSDVLHLIGEEALHNSQQVATDPSGIADWRHLILKPRDESIQVEGRVAVDFRDRLQVVLVRAHGLH